MSKKNKNFRKKDTNLGIKVGDWFEDISGSERGLKDFYMVKSLNQTSVRFVEIGTDDGELSEVLCGDYDINNFKKVKNILEYDYLKLKKIGGDEARNRLKKVKDVSLILECFGVDQKKVNSQNSSSTRSTTPENKPKEEEDLGIKVGDWLRGTEYSSIDLESIFFVSKIESDSIFLENAKPRNITFDQSIESEPWNKANFYREEEKVYFKSEDLFIEFEKISKDEVLETLRSWSTTIDWTFKRLMSDTHPNKKLMTIENFLERGKDFSGKCIIVKPLTGRVATCIKVDRAKRGDEVYMNVEHSSIVFYPEIAFEIPIDSKNSRHCRTEKDFIAGKEMLYDTHTLIEIISEEDFMTLRNEVSSQNPSSTQSTTPENKPMTAKDLGIEVGELKNCRYLKYNKDNKTYYLRYPRFEEREINGQKILFVPADNGVTIIDNQVHYYNLIRLVFENQSEFFNNATEIDEYEFRNICELLD